MIREDPGSGQPVPTSSRPGFVRRALHASFLSPYVELLRVVGFLREAKSEHAQPPPAMVALARVFTSSHSEQSR